MPDALRNKIKENLILAASLGLLTLLIAAISIVDDSRSAAFEQSALADPSTSAFASFRADDPAFKRVHSVRDSTGISYGIVFSERSREFSALFGALFSAKGELRELKLIGRSSSRLPENAKDALEAIVGSDDVLDRAAKAAVAAAGADS